MKEKDIIKQFDDNHESHQKLMDKLDQFSDKMESVKIQIAELPDELTRRFDERYASKETELSLKRIMWIVISAVMVGALSMVIKS